MKIVHFTTLAMLMFSGFACSAEELKKTTIQVAQNEATQTVTKKKSAGKTSAAAHQASPYKPTGILVSLDFESEQIQSF